MSDELALTADEAQGLLIDWAVLSEGLPDNYADWLPFLVFGVPYVRIAEIFGCHKSTITKAVQNFPNLGRAIALGRKMVKRQLHYLWLDQKAVSAWRNVDEFLHIDPFERDDGGKFVHDAPMRRTLFAEKAKMTRFILQQLGLHVQRYEVTHNVAQPMFMGDETLARLVVEQIKDALDESNGRATVEEIIGEYRIIDVGEDVEPLEPIDDEKDLAPAYDRTRASKASIFSGQDTV